MKIGLPESKQVPVKGTKWYHLREKAPLHCSDMYPKSRHQEIFRCFILRDDQVLPEKLQDYPKKCVGSVSTPFISLPPKSNQCLPCTSYCSSSQSLFAPPSLPCWRSRLKVPPAGRRTWIFFGLHSTLLSDYGNSGKSISGGMPVHGGSSCPNYTGSFCRQGLSCISFP